MADKRFMFGPLALTNTLTTNVFNPGTTTGGVNCTSAPYDKLVAVIEHVRITNKTAGAVTFSLWKGATGANAAGTEFIGTAVSVPANDSKEFFGSWPFYTTDFLVGGAGAGTSLTIEGEGTLGVA